MYSDVIWWPRLCSSLYLSNWTSSLCQCRFCTLLSSFFKTTHSVTLNNFAVSLTKSTCYFGMIFVSLERSLSLAALRTHILNRLLSKLFYSWQKLLTGIQSNNTHSGSSSHLQLLFIMHSIPFALWSESLFSFFAAHLVATVLNSVIYVIFLLFIGDERSEFKVQEKSISHYFFLPISAKIHHTFLPARSL